MFPHQKSIDEKGTEGIEEERRLAYVAITRAKRELYISFANQRKFYGRQNDNYDFYSSLQSRFIDEIDNEFVEIFINENEEKDFIFDQDYNIENKKNSPGWNRLKNNIKNNEEKNVKTLNISKNLTIFTVGETVTHEGFGKGKIIHIEGNKLLINFIELKKIKFLNLYVSLKLNEKVFGSINKFASPFNIFDKSFLSFNMSFIIKLLD